MAGRARCWMVTINNPLEIVDPSAWELCLYAVWQLELSETGTVHFQMYVNFSTSMRRRAVSECEGLEHAHLEQRMGTKAEAAAYCSKADTRLEGPWYWPSKEAVLAHVASEQGKRTDLDSLAEMVKSGMTNHQIAIVAPVHLLKHSRGIEALRLASTPGERLGDAIDAIVYVGPSGTGKSYRLRRECPEGPDWFWVSPGKWFDGYEGQAGLVFDEFRDTWCPYSYLLKLVDVYPFRVEKKGSHVNMRAFRFRFSSNVHPMDWWRNRQGKVPWASDPLRRRLGMVTLMDEPFPGQPEPVDTAAEWWLRQPEQVNPAARALFGERMDG